MNVKRRILVKDYLIFLACTTLLSCSNDAKTESSKKNMVLDPFFNEVEEVRWYFLEWDLKQYDTSTYFNDFDDLVGLEVFRTFGDSLVIRDSAQLSRLVAIFEVEDLNTDTLMEKACKGPFNNLLVFKSGQRTEKIYFDIPCGHLAYTFKFKGSKFFGHNGEYEKLEKFFIDQKE